MNIVEDRTQFWIDRYIRHLAATASSSTLGAYGFDLYQAQEYALDNGLPGIDKWQREHADSWARWLKGDKLYSGGTIKPNTCLLYTSPSPRDRQKSRMPSSA